MTVAQTRQARRKLARIGKGYQWVSSIWNLCSVKSPKWNNRVISSSCLILPSKFLMTHKEIIVMIWINNIFIIINFVYWQYLWLSWGTWSRKDTRKEDCDVIMWKCELLSRLCFKYWWELMPGLGLYIFQLNELHNSVIVAILLTSRNKCPLYTLFFL